MQQLLQQMLIGYRITNKSYTNIKVPLLYINNSSIINNNNRDSNQETYYKPNQIDVALEAHLYKDKSCKGALPSKFTYKVNFKQPLLINFLV